MASTTKLLYSNILNHTENGITPISISIKTLAHEVGRTDRSVQRALSVLISEGLVLRTFRRGKHNENIPSVFEAKITKLALDKSRRAM